MATPGVHSGAFGCALSVVLGVVLVRADTLPDGLQAEQARTVHTPPVAHARSRGQDVRSSTSGSHPQTAAASVTSAGVTGVVWDSMRAKDARAISRSDTAASYRLRGGRQRSRAGVLIVALVDGRVTPRVVLSEPERDRQDNQDNSGSDPGQPNGHDDRQHRSKGSSQRGRDAVFPQVRCPGERL